MAGDGNPVKAKLLKLMREGLDRHEALHAIGSVLAEHLCNMLSLEASEGDPNIRYHQALESLTAESWRQSG